MQILDAEATASVLPYPRLIAALEGVLAEYDRGEITSPERLVVPCAGGGGMLLSMPCEAKDMLAHKLLTIFRDNPARGLPAIQGQVTAFDGVDGRPLFSLDGPTVTARRTAAISVVGMKHLRAAPPARVLLIGTGVQARGHVAAILDTFPDAVIRVRASPRTDTRAFCATFQGGAGRIEPASAADERDADTVVAVTSSRTPVYDEAADPGRLVIGVGAYRLDMAEIGAQAIRGSQIYVDDLVGAPGEAGDIVAAGVDWGSVKTLASAIAAPPDFSRPVFFKSVGCAAWDLAACRAARHALDR